MQSFSLNSQDRLLTYQVLNSAVPRSTLLIASINIVSTLPTAHTTRHSLQPKTLLDNLMRLDTLSLCSLQTTKIYEPLRISITLKYLLLKSRAKNNFFDNIYEN